MHELLSLIIWRIYSITYSVCTKIFSLSVLKTWKKSCISQRNDGRLSHFLEYRQEENWLPLNDYRPVAIQRDGFQLSFKSELVIWQSTSRHFLTRNTPDSGLKPSTSIAYFRVASSLLLKTRLNAMLTFALGLNVKVRLLQLGNSILANLVSRAFPFSRPTHFLREKP